MPQLTPTKSVQRPIGKPFVVLVVIVMLLGELIGLFGVVAFAVERTKPKYQGVIVNATRTLPASYRNRNADTLLYAVDIEGDDTTTTYELNSLKIHNVGDKVSVTIDTDDLTAKEGLFDRTTIFSFTFALIPIGFGLWWLLYWRKHRGY